MSPESPTTRQQRERQERRDHQKWELIKAHDASRPNQQFDAQVLEWEASIIEGIENRKSDVPDGTNMNNLAYETVKKNWIEQGIWSDEWVNMPSEQWMHEEPTVITPEPETYPGDRPLLGLFGDPLERALPTGTGKNAQQGGERQAQAKRRPGDEPSRPFHQFIYQISKEQVRLLDARPSLLFRGPEPPAANINTNAYERVKSIWVKRGIWNEEWGILPGMAWKHESPLRIPDDDCDSVPSPVKPRATVAFNIFQDLMPAQADGPAPTGGQGTKKRKRAAAPVETKRTKRKVSKPAKPEASSSRRAVGIPPNQNQVDVPDQGTRDTGRRRSKRIQNRTKSSK